MACDRLARVPRPATKVAYCLCVAAACMWLIFGRESAAYQAVSPAQPTAQERQAEQFVTQAKAHLQKSEWDLAIQNCGKALEVVPTGLAAYLARGMAFNGKGEYDNAIKDFDHITAQPGRDTAAVALRAEAFTQRSFSFYQKGAYLKAVDSAYFAVLEKGDHVEAHNHRTLAYLARNQYDKAIGSANRMIQINAKSAEGYSNRGAAYCGQGNFDQALADQKKALELDPRLAVAFQRRAAAHFGKKDMDNARKDLD